MIDLLRKFHWCMFGDRRKVLVEIPVERRRFKSDEASKKLHSSLERFEKTIVRATTQLKDDNK